MGARYPTLRRAQRYKNKDILMQRRAMKKVLMGIRKGVSGKKSSDKLGASKGKIKLKGMSFG